MANGLEISRFWASVGVKVNTADLRKVDKLLADIESRFSKAKGKNSFGFDVNKPSINKKALDKTLGDALDSASARVTFQISKFAVNERNLQAALTRAARGMRNIPLDFNVGSRRGRVQQVGSSISNHTAFRAERWFNPRGAEHAGFGIANAGIGRLGMTGIGFGLLGAAAYGADRRLDEVQGRVIKNDTNRILLGQSVGGSDERKKNAIEWYKRNANKYGVNAEAGITDFNTAIALQRGNGIGTRAALGNYDLFSQRFAVRHLTPDQQKAAMRQITQILGKQRVGQQDMNALVEGGGDPEIKTLVQKAWAKRTNYTGENLSGDYQSAQKKGLVTSGDLISAYQISSIKYTKELDESINSVRANAERLANDKFWNQFARDGKEIEDATKDRIAAERELEQAMKPLKDSINQAEIASMKFAASLLSASAKFIGPAWESLFSAKDSKSGPGYFPKLTNAISNTGDVLELVGNSRGLSPAQRLEVIRDLFSEKSGSMSLDDWKKKISGYGVHNVDNPVSGGESFNEDIPKLTDDMRTPKGDAKQTTTITIGDLNIQSPATNAQDFGLDLQNQLKPLLENAWSEAQLNYTKTGR